MTRQRGGNLGHTYSFGGPITPGAPIGNTAEVIPQSSCLATPRFGEVSFPTTGLGLPGMSGGARRKKKRGTRGKKQRGGRYSFDLSAPLNPSAGPGFGGIPQVMRIPCEAAVSNPLNPVQLGGVGGVDSAFYAAPTAGYGNTPSSWVGSTGAPSMLQTPYEARTTPPVCFKTGGGKKKTRRGKKSTRRGKKGSRRR
jgi:hypothetical protein